MKGRKPKPTGMKLVQGTYRKDRSNPDEPKPVVVMPDCPPELDADARTMWFDLGQKLLAMGVISDFDGDSFAVLCATRSKLRQIWLQQPMIEKLYLKAMKKLDMKSMGTIRAERKYLMQQERLYIDKWHKMAVEFGLTPSSRTRIKVDNSGKKASEYDEWKQKQKKTG